MFVENNHVNVHTHATNKFVNKFSLHDIYTYHVLVYHRSVWIQLQDFANSIFFTVIYVIFFNKFFLAMAIFINSQKVQIQNLVKIFTCNQKKSNYVPIIYIL